MHRDDLHATLAFLGSLPSAEPVVEALAGVPVELGPVRTGEALLLPPRRPRVLAVGLADLEGACGRLQARVSAALSAAGLYAPEDRPWLAHVTLARTRERVSRTAPLPAVEPLEFVPPAMTLYASRPGARYEALARFER